MGVQFDRWQALGVGVAVAFAACVSAEPRTLREGADGAVEDVTDTHGGSGEAEETGDSAVTECEGDEACQALTVGCFAGACVGGECAARVDLQMACDDGNPCTGNGVCGPSGECLPGAALEDSTSCDEDGEVCNGTAICLDGACVRKAPQVCEASENPCVSVTCDEKQGGICSETNVEDGRACQREGGNGTCRRGLCVPEGMVLVPAGVFTMGCAGNVCGADNSPAHFVQLSAYAIDEIEVSEGAWYQCRMDPERRGNPCSSRSEDSDAPPLHPKTAAIGLTHVQANEVCAYSGKRLCTEAEWERAARGDVGQREYPWGDEEPSCERATYWTDRGEPGCGAGGPTEVGLLENGVSVFGAYDMAGNAAEWVADVYRADAYNRGSAEVVDPRVDGTSDGESRRVVRGGSFMSTAVELRTFVRQDVDEDDDEAIVVIGARCCMSLGAQ